MHSLREPGQVSFSLRLPVFSLPCSCLFPKGPRVAQRSQSPPLPTVPALPGGGDWSDSKGSPTRAGPALAQAPWAWAAAS